MTLLQSNQTLAVSEKMWLTEKMWQYSNQLPWQRLHQVKIFCPVPRVWIMDDPAVWTQIQRSLTLPTFLQQRCGWMNNPTTNLSLFCEQNNSENSLTFCITPYLSLRFIQEDGRSFPLGKYYSEKIHRKSLNQDFQLRAASCHSDRKVGIFWGDLFPPTGVMVIKWSRESLIKGCIGKYTALNSSSHWSEVCDQCQHDRCTTEV